MNFKFFDFLAILNFYADKIDFSPFDILLFIDFQNSGNFSDSIDTKIFSQF